MGMVDAIMEPNSGELNKWFLLAAVVLILDQVSKFWITTSMFLYESIGIIPFFQLTYVQNQGAAFSFLDDAGGWQRWFFIGLSLVASIFITLWLSRLPKTEKLQCVGLAMVLGGAIGNLIDRVIYGYVIDFLDVYYQHWHWPVFNLADSAITVGVFVLLLDSFRNRESSQ